MNPKVYFYTDEEVGTPWLGPDADRITHEDFEPFPEPRFNWCAFPSFEPTEDPKQADIFVVRQRLPTVADKIQELPYMQSNEERHVFFDLRDDYTEFPVNSIFIRGSTTKRMMEANPNSISWPWPTEDFGTHMPTPSGGWQYDVGFMGQAKQVAHSAMASITAAGLSHRFQINNTFWPHICEQDKLAGENLRRVFLENMQAGRLSLCPMTLDGVIRYRLYEAMSMARVNVLLCDNCVLPMQDKIDWPKYIIPSREQDAGDAGPILDDWLGRHSDKEIWEMGLAAREMWVKWLWRGNWEKNVDLVVRERLGL